jgi:hypothetical protein
MWMVTKLVYNTNFVLCGTMFENDEGTLTYMDLLPKLYYVNVNHLGPDV